MNNQLKWEIFKRFSRKNVFGFSIQEVVDEFPERNRKHLSRLLPDMVQMGMLCRIDRNRYHIMPLDADVEAYFPGKYQLAKYFMQNKDYYIGYGSALELYRLARYSSTWKSEIKGTVASVPETGTSESRACRDRIYIVTSKPMRPAIRIVRGITIQFIHHNVIRFLGFESHWINNYEKAMVSDLERTIVDISEKPEYCGGIIIVGTAIYEAHDWIDYNSLFFYFECIKSKSARKRFLYITELLGLEWTTEHDRMMEEIGSGISLLDPLAPDQGRIIMKYGLKINVNPDIIKEKILSPYTRTAK